MESERKAARQKMDALFPLFQMYASVQLQADTNDYNRTSVFTLIQGLLVVGFQQSVANASGPKVFGFMVALVGVILSVSWLFVEQRTLLYFKARARILRGVEVELADVFETATGAKFQRFWTVDASFVEDSSSWYQRKSAQRIVRLYLPLLFSLLWLGLGAWLTISDSIASEPVEIRIVNECAVSCA